MLLILESCSIQWVICRGSRKPQHIPYKNNLTKFATYTCMPTVLLFCIKLPTYDYCFFFLLFHLPIYLKRSSCYFIFKLPTTHELFKLQLLFHLQTYNFFSWFFSPFSRKVKLQFLGFFPFLKTPLVGIFLGFILTSFCKIVVNKFFYMITPI